MTALIVGEYLPNVHPLAPRYNNGAVRGGPFAQGKVYAVTGTFDEPRIRNGNPATHQAADYGCPEGTQLYIHGGDGRVTFDPFWDSRFGNVFGYEWWTNVEPSDPSTPRMQVRIVWLHLLELPDFKAGDPVWFGQPVALSGNTGTATTGPHLHENVYIHTSTKVDPLQQLAPEVPFYVADRAEALREFQRHWFATHLSGAGMAGRLYVGTRDREGQHFDMSRPITLEERS